MPNGGETRVQGGRCSSLVEVQPALKHEQRPDVQRVVAPPGAVRGHHAPYRLGREEALAAEMLGRAARQWPAARRTWFRLARPGQAVSPREAARSRRASI